VVHGPVVTAVSNCLQFTVQDEKLEETERGGGEEENKGRRRLSEVDLKYE